MRSIRRPNGHWHHSNSGFDVGDCHCTRGGDFPMARGGEANAKYGNKMMVLRVSLQGATLLLLAFLFMSSR